MNIHTYIYIYILFFYLLHFKFNAISCKCSGYSPYGETLNASKRHAPASDFTKCI